MSSFIARICSPLLALLSAIGRQGTRALVALVVIGIACPPLGAVLKPHVTPAIFILLCLSFMRLDVAALRSHLRRPGLVVAATLWTVLVVPLAVGLSSSAVGLPAFAPGLHLGLMLQSVASPMMAAPALAALMGLDATLVLITLVTSTALVPFTAPLFAAVFFGGMLDLSPQALGLKLGAILVGAILVAMVLRRLIGATRIARHKAPIDGINIVVLLVFVSGVMENVGVATLHDPLGVSAMTLLAFAVFALMLAATIIVFRGMGAAVALALALMVCQRNMGLMLAATDGVLPSSTWLYFALSQLPIYLSPLLLRPLARRLAAAPAAECAPAAAVEVTRS
ncbi:Na+-dependent transporter [Bradyrhizobium sp. WD16]|uniref:Na+-dependent transporter n=1 Tax=Bradyrhizobium sp. WD16 TaxID=1521768 RepID=UPI0020A23509|nr:Na+-dependent transporter [Bradyrhizobium sp. WD16]UTD27271.1 Na+-dependent transporter [Bradyrhizobium sp. WD16]